MKINAGSGQYVPKNTAGQVIHSGPGKVHAILATVDASGGNFGSLTLYDRTSAAAPVLIRVNAHYSGPVLLQLGQTPLRFSAGLTAATTPHCDAFIITET